MQNTDYLIIGGGVAGTTAAESIRNNDHRGSITIVSDEPYPLYSRVKLSKPAVLLRDDSPFLKMSAWYKQHNITLIKGKRAVKLSPRNKTVTLNDSTRIAYGKLLLALGTAARRWNVPGGNTKGIYTVKTLNDAKHIKTALKNNVHSAVAIGSGFISFEMCDVLRQAGIATTVVMLEPYYWHPILNKEAGKVIESALTARGVTIVRQQAIKEVLGKRAVRGVVLQNGTTIDCQLVICGIGVVPHYDWLAEAGITIGRGVYADAYLQTSDPNIWTAGDAAEYQEGIFGEHIQLGNWANAQLQGQTAGHNMSSDEPMPYSRITSYNSTACGTTVSFIGNVRPSAPRRKTIAGGSVKTPRYRLFHIKENRVVGAILINSAPDIAPITALITKKIDISAHKKELADISFDVKTLL